MRLVKSAAPSGWSLGEVRSFARTRPTAFRTAGWAYREHESPTLPRIPDPLPPQNPMQPFSCLLTLIHSRPVFQAIVYVRRRGQPLLSPFMISIRNPENLFHFWSGSDIVLWACEISFMPQSATFLPPRNMSRCLPFLIPQMQMKSDVVRCVQWDVFRRTNGPEASALRPGGAFGLPQMACDVLLLYLMACFERPCVGAVDSLTKRSGWSTPVYHRAWVRAFNDGKV